MSNSRSVPEPDDSIVPAAATAPAPTAANHAWVEWTLSGLLAGFAFGFGALIGGLLLSGWASELARLCGWNALANHAYWWVPLTTGSLNGLRSLVKSRRHLLEQQRREAVGKNLGLASAPLLADDISDTIERLYGGQLTLLTRVLQRQFGNATLVVCDVLADHQANATRRQMTSQPVVFVREPALRLPLFRLQPKSPNKTASKPADAPLSSRPLATPPFTQAYDLWLEDIGAYQTTEALFDASLQSDLADHPGWQIHADGSSVLLWQPARRGESELPPDYIDEATLVYARLRQRALQWQSSVTHPAPRSLHPSEHESRLHVANHSSNRATADTVFADTAGPSLATSPQATDPPRRFLSLAACQPVTTADLQALVTTPPPRRLPASLHGQKLGFPIVGAFGLLFAAGGSIFIFAAWHPEIQVKGDQEWLLAAFGIACFVIGSSFLLGSILHRRYWSQILIHGLLAEATVLRVERSNTKINNQRLFWVQVEFDSQQGRIQTRLALYGRSGEQALQDQGLRITRQVLYAPHRPQQAVLVEALR